PAHRGEPTSRRNRSDAPNVCSLAPAFRGTRSTTTLSEEDEKMGLGVSIFLIAVGAILTWGVNATVSGLELQTIGVILMVVGALGLVLSMIFWSSWGGVPG